jgi:hypothetical protein
MRGMDLEALVGQRLGHQLAEQRLILDQQHGGFPFHGTRFLSSGKESIMSRKVSRSQ